MTPKFNIVPPDFKPFMPDKEYNEILRTLSRAKQDAIDAALLTIPFGEAAIGHILTDAQKEALQWVCLTGAARCEFEYVPERDAWKITAKHGPPHAYEVKYVRDPRLPPPQSTTSTRLTRASQTP